MSLDARRCGAEITEVVDGVQVVAPTPATPMEGAAAAARELRDRPWP